MKRVTVARVAELAKVTASTIHAYKTRGQMPAPSDCPTCGHHPTWVEADITAWLAARPGRGAGGGRPRRCPSDWGNATEAQRCTLSEGHSGDHRDEYGRAFV